MSVEFKLHRMHSLKQREAISKKILITIVIMTVQGGFLQSKQWKSASSLVVTRVGGIDPNGLSSYDNNAPLRDMCDIWAVAQTCNSITISIALKSRYVSRCDQSASAIWIFKNWRQFFKYKQLFPQWSWFRDRGSIDFDISTVEGFEKLIFDGQGRTSKICWGTIKSFKLKLIYVLAITACTMRINSSQLLMCFFNQDRTCDFFSGP